MFIELPLCSLGKIIIVQFLYVSKYSYILAHGVVFKLHLAFEFCRGLLLRAL